MEDYAFRVSENMADDAENTVLVGHSFGGVLAQEIAKIRPVKMVILLSSIRSRSELPGVFRLVDLLGLHPFFSKKTTFATFPFWAKKNAYDTPEKQALFKSMVGQHSDELLRWSLKNLCSWQGAAGLETPVTQIHGDLDRTFPIQLLAQPDFVVKGGTHMMVFDRAEEVKQLIVDEIGLFR